MELSSIPPDDLMDVVEMTEDLEELITVILVGSPHNLAMSALMSATINIMLGQCINLDEVVFYRNVYMQMLDKSIKNIKIKKPEFPF
jgi:hypothetical protein